MFGAVQFNANQFDTVQSGAVQSGTIHSLKLNRRSLFSGLERRGLESQSQGNIMVAAFESGAGTVTVIEYDHSEYDAKTAADPAFRLW